MATNHITSFLSSLDDPSNFLKILESLGPCIEYSRQYNPKEIFSYLLNWNGMPKKDVVLAFECHCHKLISLKPHISEKTIDISHLGVKAGLEHLIKRLPQNHKISWWKCNDAYLKATIEKWDYEIHSAWLKPWIFFGKRHIFLLSCRSCERAYLIEIKNIFFLHPHCQINKSVPISTLNKIRQLDKNTWSHLLWHTHLEHKHYTAWGERVKII